MGCQSDEVVVEGDPCALDDFLDVFAAPGNNGTKLAPESTSWCHSAAHMEATLVAVRRRRLSLCLSLSMAGDPNACIDELDAQVRQVQWSERDLVWHDITAPAELDCGFASLDMYTEFSESEQPDLPPWMLLPGGKSSSDLEACCSLESPEEEQRSCLASLLLDKLRHHFSRLSERRLGGARVHVVSDARCLPLLRLPSLLELDVPKDVCLQPCGLEKASALLDWAGLFVVSDALPAEDASVLRQLTDVCISQAETQLLSKGREIGSGEVSFAEIGSRGKQRWDLLLHVGGRRVGFDPAAAGEQLWAVLERVAEGGPWSAAVRSALGDACRWQASVICSRPGAPAGRWHADGGHSAFSFDGESGAASAICVFVPLVPLEPPTLGVGGEGVRHGRGCTAFWPGSHRHRACAHLGSAAASRLRVVLPGAPLKAGAALIYDYRLVHCASPNDAEADSGERPILQLTYFVGSGDGISQNYGHELLYDA